MSSIAYTVNDKGEVWTLHEQGGGDLLSPANQDFAQDIGVNTDGTAWVISTEARPGGAVPQWSDNSEPHKWTALAPPAAAVRIAVAKDGTAYTVNTKGEVWTLHQQGGGRLLSPSGQDFAQDIGVGADGTVWIISTEARPGGAVPKWLAETKDPKWVSLAAPAAAAQIAVR